MRSFTRWHIVLSILMGLVGSTAGAQVCEGRPGSSAGRVALGAAFATANGASELGVGITGLGTGAYGGATVGRVTYDDFSGSTTTVGATVGYQVAVGSAGRAQLCPFLTGQLGFGPNDIEGTGVDASVRNLGAGVTWGIVASQSEDVTLIPTVSAGVASASIKFSDGVSDITLSDTYGQLRFGLGVAFGRQFAVTPSIIVPLGLDDSDPVLGVNVSLYLRRRGAAP